MLSINGKKLSKISLGYRSIIYIYSKIFIKVLCNHFRVSFNLRILYKKVCLLSVLQSNFRLSKTNTT